MVSPRRASKWQRRRAAVTRLCLGVKQGSRKQFWCIMCSVFWLPLGIGGKMLGNPGYNKSRPDKAGRSSGHQLSPASQSFYAAGFEDGRNQFNCFTGFEDGPSYLTGPWILGREPINQLGNKLINQHLHCYVLGSFTFFE